MLVYLVVPPADARDAAVYNRPLAHEAYRMGEHSTLLRQAMPLQTHSGLLAVTDRDAPFIQDPEALCSAVLRECGRRSYTGVLLDFDAPPRRDLHGFVQRLFPKLRASRRTLVLPESYAADASGAQVLLSTALSGGKFAQRLQDAADVYGGADHLALDVQRLRMAFTLPAPTGEGVSLTQEQFESLIQDFHPSVFFSPELCARYFTYSQDGETHFVLFDDADTLSRKLQFGEQFGAGSAFLLYAEVQELLPKLLPPIEPAL